MADAMVLLKQVSTMISQKIEKTRFARISSAEKYKKMMIT